MSLAEYFTTKCLKNLEENIALALAKLSDPASLVTVNASRALVDAAAGGMGSLAAFAGTYIKQNAAALVLATAGALGYSKAIANALNLAYNLIALSLMYKNDLLLMFLKKIAKNAIQEINKKDALIVTLQVKIQALYNALSILTAGDPVWNKYVQQLREALVLLSQSKADLQLVRNTLSATDYFLNVKFQDAKTKINTAHDLIVPLKNNPYLEPTWKGLLTNVGAPTSPQQIAAIMSIPALSKDVAKTAQNYLGINITLSALLDAFMVGYDQLQSGMPSLIKKYVISLFDNNLNNLGDLTRTMALNLNGDKAAMQSPVANFEPQPLAVSVLTYKWAMDLNLIRSSLAAVPATQLTALNVSAGAVAYYKNVVDKLRAMDGKTSSGAVLIQQDGKEATGAFEVQLLTFLIEANAAIVSASVRKEILPLGRSLLERQTLALQADAEIKALLQGFVDYPLPDNAILEQIFNGIFKMLKDLGLDNALAKLNSGDFAGFLGLNGNTATVVGEALAIVALLKKCYNNTTNTQLNEIESDLASQKDLLNISLSINFDLAIAFNIQDCLKLNGFAKVFNLQELFCSLVKKSATVNAGLQKFVDFVSF